MADDRQIQRGQNERAGWIGGVLKGLFFAFSRLSGIRALVVLAALTVCSCMQATSDVTSADHPNASDTIRSIDLQPRYPKSAENVEPNRGRAPPASYFGTPAEAVVRDPPPTSDGAGGFALNFENTSVATVAKVVLGDILSVGYVIGADRGLEPRVQGRADFGPPGRAFGRTRLSRSGDGASSVLHHPRFRAERRDENGNTRRIRGRFLGA